MILETIILIGFIIYAIALALIGLALLLDKVRGTRGTYEKSSPLPPSPSFEQIYGSSRRGKKDTV